MTWTFDRIILNEVCDTLDIIESNTGLTVSYEKSTLYRIGSIANSNAKFYTKKRITWSNDPINTLGIDLHLSNLDKNFEKILIKLKSIAQLWYYCSLTLYGKVLIVNSLIASLFVYKMQVIHEINDNFFESTEKVIEEFIWSGKRPKIPLECLKMHKSDGGLGLVDLRTKHRALLKKCMYSCLTNETLQELFITKANMRIDISLLLQCNLNEKDANLVCKQGFWACVFGNWCHANYLEPQNAQAVLSQVLWWNSLIRIGGKPSYYKKASINNIMYVKDIWEINRFYTFEEICLKYGDCMTWLEYNSLIAAIPNYWKYLLNTPNLIDTQLSLWDISKGKASFTRKVYWKIMRNKPKKYISAEKWKKLLGNEYVTDLHTAAFKNIYKITNVVKLRNFQYRLLYSTIFCNNVLFYWKKMSSQECDFCDNKQDILHLLYYCTYATRLWEKLEDFLTECGIQVEFSITNVIYNTADGSKIGAVANLITLITKQYLYRCKCKQIIPNVQNLMYEIKLIHDIELSNAMVTGNTSKIMRKWKPITIQLNTTYL